MRRLTTALWLAVDVALVITFFWIVTACRACNVAGVFYFCDDEGPHEIVQNPPAAWRARAADVQRELYDFTRERSPSDTANFYWRDPATIIFVRVLGHGIPGAAMRTAGDSVLFNDGEENDIGSWRHEFVHWVQPNNGWLQPLDSHGHRQIHWPPVFDYVHAPLIALGG